QREGLPSLGDLPQKNRRRAEDRTDVSQYFHDSRLKNLVLQRYEQDLKVFYGEISIDQLVRP
ncbi:MAG TPA: hypothetical protein DHV39_15380, partial [Verrucomicrobiales bacterium]|nr:hypothetical protein [Verrucomicrobiales bacterium]